MTSSESRDRHYDHDSPTPLYSGKHRNPSADPDNPPNRSGNEAKPSRWWRHRISPASKWIAGILSGVLIAFLGAYLGVFSTHLARLSFGPGQPDGLPVSIDYVATEGSGDGSATKVIPGALNLTVGQLVNLNSLNATTAARGWFSGHGAVAAGQLEIKVVVRGNRDEPVRIVDMHPVTSCRAPLSGSIFYAPGAGSYSNTLLTLNLDNPLAPPGYIGILPHGTLYGGGSNYFDHYTVSLRRNEAFTFEVLASTNAHYCEFSLEIKVLDGNRNLTEKVTDQGKPFRVTAVPALTPHPLDQAGAFSQYHDLYVGGVAIYHDPENKFGDPEWERENPQKYNPG
jgi:hypothetical protein